MLEVRASDLPPGNAHGNSLAKKGCVGIHVRPADSVADADQPLQEVVAKCLAAIAAWRRLLRGFRTGTRYPSPPRLDKPYGSAPKNHDRSLPSTSADVRPHAPFMQPGSLCCNPC